MHPILVEILITERRHELERNLATSRRGGDVRRHHLARRLRRV